MYNYSYITYHITGIRFSPNTDLSYAALNASTDEADLTFAGRAWIYHTVAKKVGP